MASHHQHQHQHPHQHQPYPQSSHHHQSPAAASPTSTASSTPAVATSAGGGVPSYKRASRKGAPRKFACDWEGCDKIYSRAEHLQRHQLNHKPREIFRCDVPDCSQAFVRQDLLARHKKRHSSSYIPRNRTSSFSVPSPSPLSPSMPPMRSPRDAKPPSVLSPVTPASVSGSASAPSPAAARTLPPPPPPASYHHQQPASAPRNASVLLTSDCPIQPRPAPLPGPHQSPVAHNPPWSPLSGTAGVNLLRQKPSYYSHELPPMHDQSPPAFATYPSSFQMASQPVGGVNGNDFTGWLFSHPDTNEYAMANPTFLENGLESAFNNQIHYDRESLTSLSQAATTPPRHPDISDESMPESRRQEILRSVQSYRERQIRSDAGERQTRTDAKLDNIMREVGGDVPGLSLDFFRDCIRYYWDYVSPRLPIVHQQTFSLSRCPMSLLLVMVALGAAQLHSQSPVGEMDEYKELADFIIKSVRFDILITEEASPPVHLWVAQSLLLLEYYEKMYSSRKMHERGHIYHYMTLTLLRRGNPLIGRAGSESPPDVHQHQNGSSEQSSSAAPGSDARLWWMRWAETESMHRVVFSAFMMDITHAAMFGHAADMAPQEIRLPLPCDESLWAGSSPEAVRQQEANLRMYGVKPVSFLEGLKSALHGKEVRTHSFGRMIIMCGLLSVAWHLRKRETHLKWFELGANSSELRDKWCRMLLAAFDDWKVSFDAAMQSAGAGGDSDSLLNGVGGGQGQSGGGGGGGGGGTANGLIQSAAVLYHLAHISLYIDIVDCQVYAKAKYLLGRKVSTRDYANAVARMNAWAPQPTTRKAVLHAFKLLYRTLVVDRRHHHHHRDNNHGGNSGGNSDNSGIQYSMRSDADPHRPWILYYATLGIWSFVRAMSQQSKGGGGGGGSASRILQPLLSSSSPHLRKDSADVLDYLGRVARLDTELDMTTSVGLFDGLTSLLDAVSLLSSESPSEILQEACGRLEVCKGML
ncbi:zinc finger protein zas1 [Xylariaceae sp. FL0804]|nr:zinc finger protein zas1 [Xylariaceae sp. FL0804]